MVLRLEVGDVVDVRGGLALRLARVAQARARGGDGLGLLPKPVAFERARAELFEQYVRAGDRLPQPVVERRQRERDAAGAVRSSAREGDDVRIRRLRARAGRLFVVGGEGRE